MTLNDFTSRGDVQNTDEFVGKRGSAAGAESRWTFAVLLAAIQANISGISHVSFPANSAASGALGQVSYADGVIAIYVGLGGSGGPNWVFINASERD